MPAVPPTRTLTISTRASERKSNCRLRSESGTTASALRNTDKDKARRTSVSSGVEKRRATDGATASVNATTTTDDTTFSHTTEPTSRSSMRSFWIRAVPKP